jgi:predicted molibdopterin-dependent oxidoreductase YjgC
VRASEAVPPGLVFASFHFREVPVNRLTNPARDPKAKIPELKLCAVRLERPE